MSINVTKTFFPPAEEYQAQLSRIWKNEWLTNRGELVQELESKIQHELAYRGHFLALNNGTIPLQIALQLVCQPGDEIITTPFSYVATVSSIVWQNARPVFVDIEPNHLTISPSQIEQKITKKTRAILATHVYGNPCDVEQIDQIAKRHGLMVIYDAAHCFGVKYKGKSVFEFGDISTCSFHATKVFHTGEGGGLFCSSETLMHELFYRHNFGHHGPEHFYGVGINGKMSELQAAMGLTVLNHFQLILQKRKEVVDYYDCHLDWTKMDRMVLRQNTEWNFSYYPVFFKSDEELVAVQQRLNEHSIFPRRYFYPSLNTLPYVDYQEMPIAESVSSRVLCLPLYVGLEREEMEMIVSLVHEVV
jgi:dTDP-4-amino-4,6-dideoxygalactose transaminase